MFSIKRKDGQPVDLAYSSHFSAGFDISASEDCTIEPGKVKIVKTGLLVDIAPENRGPFYVSLGAMGETTTGRTAAATLYPELQIRSRSGLAAKRGVMVLNSPGTVDADYPGEIGIILANFGDEAFTVNRGDRIAQGVWAFAIRDTNLGVGGERTGGFGSTGVKS